MVNEPRCDGGGVGNGALKNIACGRSVFAQHSRLALPTGFGYRAEKKSLSLVIVRSFRYLFLAIPSGLSALQASRLYSVQ